MEFLIFFITFSFLILVVLMLLRFSNSKKEDDLVFRVEYLMVATNLNTGESNFSKSFKYALAKTPEEAVEKIKQELSIQTEREFIDLGASFREYSGFRAIKI